MKINQLLLLLVLITITSCKKLVDDDISGKHIIISSPVDQLHTSVSFQSFVWQALEGADKYQLQIVRGTFSGITQFILDTTFTSVSFTVSLLPGSYQWRVRGINGATLTDYTLQSLVIQSNADLSLQYVILSAPADSAITNDTTINFTWQELTNADAYKFRILNSADSTVLTENTITAVSFSYDVIAEGTYIWMVRAENNASFTPYTSRRFTIDR
ncbi:MAG: hypothetical protein ABI772_07720 [Bacteroidota bacterium]